MKPPNLLFIFPDQMRAQATGYAGDPNVRTPNLDQLAARSLNFTTAVSGCPVCCPARASLLTGQYPHTHGVFINDVPLLHRGAWLGEAFVAAGYRTGYIGKWHLNGRGRSEFIPPGERPGFDFWRARECSHNYWDSFYYDDNPQRKPWPGYDAAAQTDQARRFIHAAAQSDQPFMLMLSWGPPHNPYNTAPPQFQNLYRPDELKLRPNVPPQARVRARNDLAGYYAHISALDECLGQLLKTLDETGLADDTIVVFWSDHGDMLGSHGQWRKQHPCEESIRVPLLIRLPARFGQTPRAIDLPINTPDLMPTLLGLADLPIPQGVQGLNYAPFLRHAASAPADAALLAAYVPFGEWNPTHGGREYRGLRTADHTYVRTLDGPWLLYDNRADPFQLNNLIDDPVHADLQHRLESRLAVMLGDLNDPFPPAQTLLDRWGWQTDENWTAPYTP